MSTLSHGTWVCLCVALLHGPLHAVADDEAVSANPSVNLPQVTATDPADPGPASPSVSIGKELSEASRQMEAAGSLIAGQETGETPQQIQKKVIGRLQLVIAGLKQASQQQGVPQPQEFPVPQTMPEETSEKPETETDTTGSEGGPSRKNAPDSVERSGDHEDHEVELANRRALLQGVWGHLRPALRSQILDLGDERNLPKYDEQVKQYFRALATSKSGNTD